MERVTALVGRNESGKTALLKALHKFNPATPEPYNPQREFPRDRYTREFKDGADWPVCSVEFEPDEQLQEKIGSLLGDNSVPKKIVYTRNYDGSLSTQYDPPIETKPVSPGPIIAALEKFAAEARRLKAPTPEKEEETQNLRTKLATWASDWQERLKTLSDLQNNKGVELLLSLRSESEKWARPALADVLEALQARVDTVLEEAQESPVLEQIDEIIEGSLPVFIYFENYGILDSAIYLPRFLQDLGQTPDDSRIRTVNAMFKHVGLMAQEIAELGLERAQQERTQNREPTVEMIEQDQQRKEMRAIKLNSASLDITRRFNHWYGQRRHTIEYQADGDYFRIWVADDRRLGVKIELESRSKGFQWFFSFYLVFLVESDEGHKDAILLLDEPGLHLHPTAQQELIAFFEDIAENNQLIYTTHSPFLIDAENLHRVRPVTEDETGHSQVSIDTWPKDRETIFPLQAAAGYAMVRGLFQHRKNVLVEGMSDYYYLHALSHQCLNTKRVGLPDDIYITPCGGTRMVGRLASLFLGQGVRPVVLLDGDEAGRVRQDALMKELYSGHESAVLMLDEILGRTEEDVEIEDVLNEEIILGAMKAVLTRSLRLSDTDRKAGSLPRQIKAAAERKSIELPEGWKPAVAIHLVSDWAENRTILHADVLDNAELVFKAIRESFPERL
jgi:predicted ATPase